MMMIMKRQSLISLLLVFLCLVQRIATGAHAWEFRIEATTNRLMTRNGSLGWGTVCDDGWSSATTTAICRIANFNADPTDVSFFTAGAGIGVTEAPTIVYLRNVVCPASAGSFSKCTFMSSAQTSLCSGAENIGIFCFPWLAQRDALTRLVKLKPGLAKDASKTPYGTLCAPNGLLPTRATAARLCTMTLGQTVPDTVAKAFIVEKSALTLAGVSASNIYASGIGCPSTATKMEHCSWTYTPSTLSSDCTSDTNVGLTCAPQPAHPHPTASWAIRIPSSATAAGTPVLVRPNSSAPWGTVCTDDIDKATATAVCKMWGRSFADPPLPDADITNMAAAWTSSGVALQQAPVQSSRMYMDQLKCKATDTSLSACSYVYSDAGQRRDDCGKHEQLILFCDQWRVRLEPGTLRLLVRPGPSVPEGTVCGTAFTANEGKMFCRMLGHEDRADMSFFFVSGGGGGGNASSGTMPIYVSSTKCGKDAKHLQSCTYSRYPDVLSGCTHSIDIGLDCNGTRTTPAPERPGMLASEIVLAVMVPLVIVLFVGIYYVAKRMMDKQEELQKRQREEAEGPGRSPSSQALTNFTSVIASPSRRQPPGARAADLVLDPGRGERRGDSKGSVADILHKKSTTTAEAAASAQRGGSSHHTNSGHRGGGGGSSAKPMFFGDDDDDERDPTPRRYSEGTSVAPPLAPRAGAAAVSNPFGRLSPHVRRETPMRHDSSKPDFSDL